MSDPALVLASSSPRRHQLLSLTGLEFAIFKGSVDERINPDESAQKYVSRLAAVKAEAALQSLVCTKNESCQQSQPGKMVFLGADTTVVSGKEILGKPADFDDARRMLGLLDNRWHQVYTGVCLLIKSPGSGQSVRALSTVVGSKVKFRRLADREIQWYWQTGEPVDKAGAYAVQGMGGIFIEKIEGSYSAVVGLPLCETVELLRHAGFSVGGLSL